MRAKLARNRSHTVETSLDVPVSARSLTPFMPPDKRRRARVYGPRTNNPGNRVRPNFAAWAKPFGFRAVHPLDFNKATREFARGNFYMRELTERRWALLSERGCEGSALTYEEAMSLEQRLKRERVNGLCIVTDEAARRVIQREPVEVR